MKIVIGLVNLQSGGTEYQMSLLTNGLISHGHTVTFYCMEGLKSDSMLSQFPNFQSLIKVRVSDPAVYFEPARYRWSRLSCTARYLSHMWRWRRWVKEDHPDVVIGALALPHLLLGQATWGLDIPVVGRRGFAWNEVDHLPGYSRAKRYLAMVRRWTIWRTSLMVCNAQHVAHSTINYEGWPPHLISIIPNGWPEFPPIDYSNTVIAYAARNRPEKCHNDVTNKLASRLNIAYFYEVPPWHSIGIYLHPSLAEGSSNSIGLAMAHGIPVVAFSTPGNAAMLYPNSLVPPRDYGTLISKVGELQSDRDLRVCSGALNQSIVRHDFPLSSMVRRWEMSLSSLVVGITPPTFNMEENYHAPSMEISGRH